MHYRLSTVFVIVGSGCSDLTVRIWFPEFLVMLFFIPHNIISMRLIKLRFKFFGKYLFIYLCVHGCVCAHTHTYHCGYMWKSQYNFLRVSSILVCAYLLGLHSSFL